MLNRYKKSWEYVRPQKKFLIKMILFLILFQITAMLSPLIIQRIIDNNILIIDDIWYKIDNDNENENENENENFSLSQKKHIVEFNKDFYISSKKVDDISNLPAHQEVSIVNFDSSYYLVNSNINKGEGKIINGVYTVDDKTYDTLKLNKDDIKLFYSPIISDSIKLIIFLLFILIINLIFSYLQRINGAYLTINTTKNIRLRAAKKLEYINISTVENDPAGKLANRFLNDSTGVADLYTSTVNVFLSSILSIVLSFIGMFILSVKMALFCLIIIPIMYFWISWFVKRIKVIAQKINESNSLIIAQVNEIINGIDILKVFGSKDQTIQKFSQLNDEYLSESIDEVALHLRSGWNGVNLFQGLFIGLVIIIFGILDIYHLSVVEAGIIYAYYTYLTKIISPVNILFHEFSRMEHANVKFERISKILAAPSEDNKIIAIPKYKGYVNFKNVNFSYNPHNKILKDINICIKPGEKVGIVGRTGAGKSTLINLLMRFNELSDNDFNTGEILIDHKSIYTNNRRTYRTHLGIILQEPIIFHGSLYSNIKMNKDLSQKQIIDLLKMVGGEKLLSKMDGDIKKEIKNRGNNLSLGEKQLIAFARVLAQNPQILIMDEATANIDTQTESIINKALEVTSKGKTTIVIAHRLSTIKDSDQIIVMDYGQVLESGTHDQLLKKGGKYKEMWMNQS